MIAKLEFEMKEILGVTCFKVRTKIDYGTTIGFNGRSDKQDWVYVTGRKKQTVPRSQVWDMLREDMRNAGVTKAADQNGYPIELLDVFTDELWDKMTK